MQRPKWNRWQKMVHLIAPWPLIGLWVAFATDRLGANPVQALVLRSGLYTLFLLTLTLAVTPAQRVLRLRGVVRARRPLGVYTFLYATAHMFSFVGVDYGFAWRLLWQEILTQKPFVWIGLGAYGVLLLLAITTPRAVARRLGARWKALHRLIYLAAILAVVHYGWVVKADWLRLQGNLGGPLRYGLVIAFLLLARLWRPRSKRKAVQA